MKDSETNNNLKVKKHWQLQVWANPSKHFKTPMNHNPAVVEFANIIWSPIMSDTNKPKQDANNSEHSTAHSDRLYSRAETQLYIQFKN